uniref:FilB3 n=2 Tax=unclassified Fischerella TaxID=494603 RepID=A0A1P8VSI3_9CYAN|nr:aminopyrrolnitrin oxidase PrnD-like Rieske oxygenase [Fischerella sp. ATCC 43239]APZ79580.1 FilB3 [Fischerella sp. TAU]
MVSHVEKSLQPKVTQSQTQADHKKINLAASWYIAMKSKEVGKKPQAIELFGRPLVAWRDQAGKAVIMERFCSHLGASLAIGQLVDGCIQCPFHHWRYDNSGVCVHIPKVATPVTDQIPATARQQTYVTQEKYGYIWVWYGTAHPLFDLPKFDVAESDNKHKYMPYRFSFTVKTSARRVMENVFDHQHLVTLHGMAVNGQIGLTLLNERDVEPDKLSISKEAWFGCTMEAEIKSYMSAGSIAKALGLDIETVSSHSDCWPSGSLGKFIFNGQQKFELLIGITPISENQTIWHVLILIKKTGNLWLDLLSYIAFGLQTNITTLQDKPIFNTMSADTGKAFIKSDEAVLKFRQFYQTWVAKVQSN